MPAQEGSTLNESGRVEAFSDGVFAIAITLLILEIKVPVVADHQDLWTALGHQWPSYAAYVVSFLVIGIMWTNHHQVFSHISKVDRTLVFLNLILLLVVAAMPWPTRLVAEYLSHGSQGNDAVAVYSAFMVAHALTFSAFWWYVTRTGHLFDPDVDTAAARATRLRFALGSFIYPVLFGLSFLAALPTLLLHGLLAVYYAFNQLPVPTSAPTPQQASSDRP
jgi:uncharacterized membrane protein